MTSYSAKDIHVLEGLEPVRRHPGMYIGGVDEKALYHLISEVLDNSMDEAVAGFAKKISVHLDKENRITISDNGRGIPVDPHPKYPKKSALEVVLTTLHSGGKFSNDESKPYSTSGGLHGVGVSVVNALTSEFIVEVKRDGKIYTQNYSRGLPESKISAVENKHLKQTGTKISFIPDVEIFKSQRYKAENVYRMACSKAYLFKGVEIDWSCDKELLSEDSTVPHSATIHFPNGLQDFLNTIVPSSAFLSEEPFVGEVEFPSKQGKCEWAVNWITHGDSVSRSYCNTIYTPQGGTHEQGLRSALLKALKGYGEIVNNKKASIITADDLAECSIMLLSVFIKSPSFQGQTKEKLLSHDAAKLVENAVRHNFDHWLTGNPRVANLVLELVISVAEERINRKKDKEVARKNPIKYLRLPGKLADCNQSSSENTELFIVEGESAGGSAKQGRNRENQAVLPLKGKILNVASHAIEKIKANQEISDLMIALGCGVGDKYVEKDLRYEKIVIMTDADVDGAHITSLLLAFFYLQMPQLIKDGHLYLAQPPLYKITHGAKIWYVKDDAEKEKIIATLGNAKPEISRFKGLGEMTAPQLKETTMSPHNRTLLKVMIDEWSEPQTGQLVENLLGKNPEMRFKFIKENTQDSFEKLDKILDV